MPITNGELNIKPLTGEALLVALKADKDRLNKDLMENQFRGLDRDLAVERYLNLGEQVQKLENRVK